MTFSTHIRDSWAWDLSLSWAWGHLGHIIRYAFERTGRVGYRYATACECAMEFLDMEKFTSILCCLLFVQSRPQSTTVNHSRL